MYTKLEETQSFEVQDGAGDRYTVVEYTRFTEYRSVANPKVQLVPGGVEYKLRSGEEVNRESADTFTIVRDGRRLTRT